MNPDIARTFAVLNQMVADGAIENYAVGGAIAPVFYVEAFSTEDSTAWQPDVPITRGVLEMNQERRLEL